MKYIAIFFGVFAAAALGGIVLAILVWLGSYVVENELWYIPAFALVALLLSLLAVSLEYLTDHREEPPA